jgi:hypothetical protein
MSSSEEPPRATSTRASVRPLAISLKEKTTKHLGEVRRGLSEIRGAAAIHRPPQRAHLRRFLYGFGLSLRILRALFADPATRKTYLRVILTQFLVVLVVAVLATVLGRAGDRLRGGAYDFRTILAMVSAFYAGLGVVEWIVVALSRDYHDQLGRRASLLSGAPPEDPEQTPRVRIDIRWLGRKLKRKLRGMMVIGVGLPAVLVVSLIPIAGKYLYPLLAFTWTTYWIGVFTASKSSFAWRTEGAVDAPEPWFLRAATRVTKDTFLGRFGLARLYVIVWRNLSSGVFPPAREFEDHPYELLGIAAFRTLLAVPGTYLFFRPILPVASAHVLCTPMSSEDSVPVEASETPNPTPTLVTVPELGVASLNQIALETEAITEAEREEESQARAQQRR